MLLPLEANVAVTVAVPGVLNAAPLQVTADVVLVPFWVTTAVDGSAAARPRVPPVGEHPSGR